MTPRISLVAYADRDPRLVFVAVPTERGRYVRTQRCVVEVACPQCGSAVGEPCGSTATGHERAEHGPWPRRYTAGVHCVRASRAVQARRDLLRSAIVPEPPGDKLHDVQEMTIKEGLT